MGGRCFTRSPWREPYPTARSVASRVLADSDRPGFALAVALSGDEVYGFAYGHRCSALALLASRTPGEDFTFKELAVVPELWFRPARARFVESYEQAGDAADHDRRQQRMETTGGPTSRLSRP
ncbi:hypothetical protein ABT294_03670 [Nonomuraea sp. NPDC000554]|uniref:hypothetical protein n=1 Tax=Nonomuraea sp. NPDC000554 TaxID=3154259 RepID=UPI003324B3C7